MTLVYFTALDNIVQSSLKSIYSGHQKPKREMPVVVGGMAIQLHTPAEAPFHRPTCDIDVKYLPKIEDYADFSQGIGKEIAQRLKRNGYQVQLKHWKGRPLYEIKIMEGQGNKSRELFFIHFDKLFPVSQKTERISEREVDNSLEVYSNGQYAIIKRMEDILPHKIRRTRRLLECTDCASDLDRALFELADSSRWDQLAKTPLDPWLGYLIDTQNHIGNNQEKMPRSYVLSKDLYDMCLLARKIEGTPNSFNRAYYANARKEVDSI